MVRVYLLRVKNVLMIIKIPLSKKLFMMLKRKRSMCKEMMVLC